MSAVFCLCLVVCRVGLDEAWLWLGCMRDLRWSLFWCSVVCDLCLCEFFVCALLVLMCVPVCCGVFCCVGLMCCFRLVVL